MFLKLYYFKQGLYVNDGGSFGAVDSKMVWLFVVALAELEYHVISIL
jgi:hypothetical protein